MPVVRRLLTMLAVLVLVTGAFGGTRGGWTCEGRPCSADLLRCCCLGPTEARDLECGSGDTESLLCRGDCGCELTSVPVAHPVACSSFEVVPHDPIVADLPRTVPAIPAVAIHQALSSPCLFANPPPKSGRDLPHERPGLRAPPVR